MDPKRTSPRPVETKTSIPNHWNLGSDLQYNQQQVFYHPGSVSSTAAPPPLPPPPPSQLSGMWLHRPPAYSDFIGLNPLTGMPPHWHQDPAAMAWIASRHMMLAGQAHPHNFPMPPGHSMSNGALPPRHYSPSSTASNHFASEEPIYSCEICARPFTSKDSLRQVCSIFVYVTILYTPNIIFLIHLNSTCWHTPSHVLLSASFAMLDLPLRSNSSRIWFCIGPELDDLLFFL